MQQATCQTNDCPSEVSLRRRPVFFFFGGFAGGQVLWWLYAPLLYTSQRTCWSPVPGCSSFCRKICRRLATSGKHATLSFICHHLQIGSHWGPSKQRVPGVKKAANCYDTWTFDPQTAQAYMLADTHSHSRSLKSLACCLFYMGCFCAGQGSWILLIFGCDWTLETLTLLSRLMFGYVWICKASTTRKASTLNRLQPTSTDKRSMSQ